MFLFAQLQEDLRYSLMESPAVSGATDYQALCLAAKNEEKRQIELKKRRGYRAAPCHTVSKEVFPTRNHLTSSGTSGERSFAKSSRPVKSVKCWHCNREGHIAKDCRVNKQESTGSRAHTKQVCAAEHRENPLQYIPIK